jgi:hypothetical protein
MTRSQAEGKNLSLALFFLFFLMIFRGVCRGRPALCSHRPVMRYYDIHL